MNVGYHIRRLRVTGPSVRTAVLDFQDSLNVISGASDTGKSYIFKCIDYMLGGKRPPKSVPEDAGYEVLGIELGTYDGSTISLERSLKKGGDFRVYRMPLSDIEDTSEFDEVSEENKPNRTDTVPYLLLDLCKMTSVKVRKNKSGDTRRLSIRDLCHFSLIGEDRIISETTPMWPSKQFTQKTAERQAFQFFISGEDSGSVIKADDVKLQKAGWRAQSEVYDELISELEGELGEGYEQDLAELESVESQIEDATTRVDELTLQLDELFGRRRKCWDDIQLASGRIATIEQLQNRFQLLEIHYQSDVERLGFVSEADFFLSQIGQGHCPICGSLLEDHDADQLRNDTETCESIQVAAAREVDKLQSHLSDLTTTMEDLGREHHELHESVQSWRNQVTRLNREIGDNLEPQVRESHEELKRSVDRRSELNGIQRLAERLESLRQKQRALGDEPKQSRRKKDEVSSSTAENQGRRIFCDALEARLTSWSFPNVGTVEFDEEGDLLINGVSRRSHGKGVMAIIHAAFTTTLMTRFRERHMGVVMLDSPLTSFKEKDRQEMGDDIQQAFYEELSSLSEQHQIIILENKDPTESVRNKLNSVHFSGVPGQGRAGFFPVGES